MDDQDIPVGPVEPGEEQELLACLDVAKGIADISLELEPGVRRPLVTLPRCLVEIGQGRGDSPDDPNFEGVRYGRVSQSISGWE
jgi:hypothetical protein